MYDFVVSGSRGFIGGHLVKILRSANCSVVSDRDFAHTTERARVFVNCANVGESPSASVRLLKQKIALAQSRVDIFVHLLSFATLHGQGAFSAAQFNCGMRPKLLNLYAAGKIEQERALCRMVEEGRSPRLLLLYLPAVLGPGGAWSANVAQSQTYGFELPVRMNENARANWIDVEDLAQFLLWQRHEPAPRQSITRVVLNRPESEWTTWPRLLGGKQVRAQHDTVKAIMADAREMLVNVLMRAVAFAYRCHVLLPAEHLFRAFRPASSEIYSISRSAQLPQEPFVFRSVMRTIATNQPYIPGVRDSQSTDWGRQVS